MGGENSTQNAKLQRPSPNSTSERAPQRYQVQEKEESKDVSTRSGVANTPCENESKESDKPDTAEMEGTGTDSLPAKESPPEVGLEVNSW